MDRHELFIVDVFAEEKYAGNQLAVVTDVASLETDVMQRIARETNFSETTFLPTRLPVDGGYDVRIFTPSAEIPFAGHPTLGTAHVIREHIAADHPPQVLLRLQIGSIPVSFEADANGDEIAWMSTPDPNFGRSFSAQELAPVVGLSADDIDTNLPIEEVSLGVPFTFLPVRSLEAIKRAAFHAEEYRQRSHLGFHACLYLFTPETYAKDNDFNARMFAEPFGISEDPATGSATACFAAYLLRHNYFGSDDIAFRVEQGCEIARPSLLRATAARRANGAEIRVGGRCITSVRGQLV